MTEPGVRAQQHAATRQRLLDTGRTLFADRGYAAVGLAAIVETAGVTKGALYHHFASKADLFRVVLAAVQREVADTVVERAARHQDPWEQFLAGCRAFLEASTDPQTQQIMLIDGPAVLGWTEWRAIDEETSARHLSAALTELVSTRIIADQPIEPLARLLSGAMNEAALWLAAEADDAAIGKVWAALVGLLDSLRVR